MSEKITAPYILGEKNGCQAYNDKDSKNIWVPTAKYTDVTKLHPTEFTPECERVECQADQSKDVCKEKVATAWMVRFVEQYKQITDFFGSMEKMQETMQKILNDKEQSGKIELYFSDKRQSQDKFIKSIEELANIYKSIKEVRF